MERHPDPLRAYANAVRAGDTRLAGLIAARVFRRGRVHGSAGADPLAPPSPAAHATLRRLLDHLGL